MFSSIVEDKMLTKNMFLIKRRGRYVMSSIKKVRYMLWVIFTLTCIVFAIYTGSLFRHPVPFIFAILMFFHYVAQLLWGQEPSEPATQKETIKVLYAWAFMFALAAGSLIYEGRVLARAFNFVLYSGIVIGCIIEAQKLKKKDKA